LVVLRSEHTSLEAPCQPAILSQLSWSSRETLQVGPLMVGPVKAQFTFEVLVGMPMQELDICPLRLMCLILMAPKDGR